MADKNRAVKTVEESTVEQVHLVRSSHMNGAGRLFGGMLLQWIDEVAGICARRHSEGNIVTAAIDNLQFLKGAYEGDMVVLIAKLTHVGNTSMEVRIDTYAETPDGTRKPINRAYVVEVALDDNGRAKPIPGLMLHTEEQQAEWEGGEKRQLMRKMRRSEGF